MRIIPLPPHDTRKRLSAMLQGLLAFAVILGVYTASVQAQSLYNPRDRAFEARMRAIDPSCMPEYPPLVTDSYAYRLGAALVDQCGRENITLQQGVKYILLAAATVAPTPAAPAAGAYTVGELQSDGMKCAAKALVDASLDMTTAEKKDWRSRIDVGFALKDWKSFAGGLKELNDPDQVAQTKAAFETIAALYERGSEYVDLLQVINDTIESGSTGISEAIIGEAKTILVSYDFALRYCRYDEAGKRLSEAWMAAKRECRYFGDKYRQAELSLRSHIYRNRRSLTDALTNPVLAGKLNAQEHIYARLHDNLQSRKTNLENYADIFDRLEKEERKLRRARVDFKNDRSDYKSQVSRVRGNLKSASACKEIAKLRKLNSAITPECRAAFFSGTDSTEMASPEDLGFELRDVAREKSSAWWAKSDEIYKDFRACRVDDAKSKIAALKADISSNPATLLINGECKTAGMLPLLKRLDGMRAPSYCFDRPVPEVVGHSYDDAVDALYEAGMQPAEKTRTAIAKEGQKAGFVVDADPAEGTMQKAGTKVALTVAKADEETEVETTTMPEVIGVESSVAAERVVKANLVPNVLKNKPADKREYKPDHVYAASAAKGDKLAIKTEVILNAYGPRPMVTVPRVAGLTPTAAKGLLAGKNLSAGDPVPGDAATGDQVPGEIYGTNPPEGDELEMFSDVTILEYAEPKEETGDDMRPIPSVIGQTVEAAAGILAGPDEFFSVGAAYLGKAAPADKKPGTVYEMVPGAETMSPKGTSVELTVYGPHADTETDQSPPPPVEPEVTGDDSDWLGRWQIHGIVQRKDKRQKINAIMDIANKDTGLMLTLFTRKDAGYKKTMSIPIRVVDGVIQTRVEQLDTGRSSSNSADGGIVGGVLKKPLSNLAKMIRQVLQTLRISREGEQCTLTFTSEKGREAMPFQCVRMENGEQ